MRRHHAVVSIAILAAIACSDNPNAPTTPPPGVAHLALLNALAAADVASLQLDGSAIALPPAGQSGTTALAAGAHTLQATGSGGVVASRTTFAVAAGDHRTAVLSSVSGHDVLLVTTLDTAAAPVVDGGKMRLVHTIAGAPLMDAYLFEVGAAADSSTWFLSPFQFGSGTDPRFPGYAVRPAGQYLVWLKASGTDNVLVQFGPVTVNNGDVYSFVLAQNAAATMELRAVKEH
jgi:hypothetical protein